VKVKFKSTRTTTCEPSIQSLCLYRLLVLVGVKDKIKDD
jgi:hypothetical protein